MIPFAFRIVKRKSPLIKGKTFIRKDFLHVPFHFLPKAGTFRAGPERIVERKKPGLKVRNGNSAVRAGILLAEKYFSILIPFPLCNNDYAAGTFKGCFCRIRKALPYVST